MAELFSTLFILVYSAIYGSTMKVADLLNEHGLKWFKGSTLLFGILWGVFGALLIYGNVLVANIVLATNLAFLIRNRLDYLNHQVASVIILLTFIIYSTLQPIFFGTFFLIFLIFGSLKDYVDDVLKKKKGAFFIFTEAGLYYPIPVFIYSLIYGNWIVFWMSLTYVVLYDITKYIAYKNGYK